MTYEEIIRELRDEQSVAESDIRDIDVGTDFGGGTCAGEGLYAIFV